MLQSDWLGLKPFPYSSEVSKVIHYDFYALCKKETYVEDNLSTGPVYSEEKLTLETLAS